MSSKVRQSAAEDCKKPSVRSGWLEQSTRGAPGSPFFARYAQRCRQSSPRKARQAHQRKLSRVHLRFALLLRGRKTKRRRLLAQVQRRRRRRSRVALLASPPLGGDVPQGAKAARRACKSCRILLPPWGAFFYLFRRPAHEMGRWRKGRRPAACGGTARFRR